jgi:hypothetical protein
VATIGDWTTTQLVKFIKDILENQPPRNLPSAIIGDASVNGTLAIKGKVSFPGNTDFRIIGAAGEPTFKNSWVNWGPPFFDAGYWHDPMGFVHLQGIIKSGTVGSPAFTLPPGLWPAATAGPFSVNSNSTSGAGRIDVSSNGDVTPMLPAVNGWVSLHGVYFKAD